MFARARSARAVASEPRRCQLERLRCPLLDAVHVQSDRPHRRPDGRLEREECVRLRPLGVVERAVGGAEQRQPHPFAVVAKRLRLADRTPEERLLVRRRPRGRRHACRARPPPPSRAARGRGGLRATASARPARELARAPRGRPPTRDRRPADSPPPSSGTRAAVRARLPSRPARATRRSAACSLPRRAFGIEPYATSRVRACLIANSRSSPSVDPRRSATRSRSSRTPKSGSTPSSR